MRPLEVGGADQAEHLVQRRLQDALVDEARDLVQQLALRRHIGGLEHRAGEHELPVDGDALALQRIDIEGLRIIDQRQAPLRGDQLDDNDGKGYWSLLYKGDSPVPGAWSGLGDLLYGSWVTEKCRFHISQNLDSARKYFQKEIENQPEVKNAYMRQYLASLKMASLEEEKRFREELDYFSKLPNLSERDFDVLKNNYQRLKDTTAANYFNREMLSRFPNGSWAVQTKSLAMLMELGKNKDFSKQAQIYKQFKDEYSINYEDEFATRAMNGRTAHMLSYMVAHFVSEGTLDIWEKELEELPAETKIMAYQLSVRRILDNTKLENAKINKSEHPFFSLNFNEPDRGLIAAKTLSFSAIEVWKNSFNEPRRWNEPALLTDTDVKLKRQLELSQLFSLLGEVQLKQNELHDAQISLESSVKRSNYSDLRTNELFIEALVKSGEHDLALAESAKMIKIGQATPLIESYYSSSKKKKEAFENLKEQSLKILMEDLKRKRTKEKAPDFTAYDFNEKEVNLKSLRDKIVVINFWASWCPPCIEDLKHMNQLVERYKQDEEIVFLFVNEDNSRERAMKIINLYEDKRAFTFDREQRMIKKFGVSGLPTQIIIGKKGEIYFRTSGFISNSSHNQVLMVEAMIELSR